MSKAFAFVIVLVLSLASSAGAQVVTSVSGTIGAGHTIVVSGAFFGTKAVAAPWIFEGFEGTTCGLDIVSSNGDIDPQITSAVHYSGAQSLNTQNGLPDGTSVDGRHGYAVYNFPHALVEGERFYLNVQQRWSWGLRRCTPTDVLPGYVPATADYQIKNWRISSTPTYPLGSPNIMNYNQSDCDAALTEDFDPRNFIQHNDGTGSSEFTQYFGPAFDPYEPMLEEVWINWEIQLVQSTSELYGWEIWLSRNGVRSRVSSRFYPTHDAADYAFQRILIGEWIDSIGGYVSSYWDNFYADNSWARVMIGDNATLSNCGHLEIQIPSSWSASSITATVNQGSFSAGEQAYLFVITSAGIASNGYVVTIGAPSTQEEVTAPYNLRVVED